jgi:hypothetical protein
MGGCFCMNQVLFVKDKNTKKNQAVSSNAAVNITVTKIDVFVKACFMVEVVLAGYSPIR